MGRLPRALAPGLALGLALLHLAAAGASWGTEGSGWAARVGGRVYPLGALPDPQQPGVQLPLGCRGAGSGLDLRVPGARGCRARLAALDADDAEIGSWSGQVSRRGGEQPRAVLGPGGLALRPPTPHGRCHARSVRPPAMWAGRQRAPCAPDSGGPDRRRRPPPPPEPP